MKKTTHILSLLLSLLIILPGQAEVKNIYIPDLDQSFPFAGIRVQEPPDDVTMESLDASDYGLLVMGEKEPHYYLEKGQDTQTPVYLLDSGKPGPDVYILAGTHGDERAGWYAAHVLQGLVPLTGRVFLLPRANILGCQAVNRHVKASQDLNRAYPGNPKGDESQRLAYAIYQDILRVNPALVLDLHEAAVFTQGRDFLGNKLIFTNLTGMEELFFDLLTAYEEATLGRKPFGFVSPGEKDSLNDVLSNQGGIPILTVETFRGFPLSHRIQDQVDIVLHCLRFYGMY